MTEPSGAPLKTTPLNARHRSLGARMVGFAGWDMPVEYAGVSETLRESRHVSRVVGAVASRSLGLAVASSW